jgi:hypothetical protein
LDFHELESLIFMYSMKYLISLYIYIKVSSIIVSVLHFMYCSNIF